MLRTSQDVEAALSGAYPVHVEVRDELNRRLAWLDPEEATVLHRWYVEALAPALIAGELRRSVRHVYRVRADAIARISALGQHDEFVNADVADFV